MTSVVAEAAALAGRILSLAQAQGRAVDCDDWAEFERLSDERDDLQARLANAAAADASAPLTEMLRQALAEDRKTAQLIRGLQSQTGHRVRDVHHAHSALLGYERETREETAPILLDAER